MPRPPSRTTEKRKPPTLQRHGRTYYLQSSGRYTAYHDGGGDVLDDLVVMALIDAIVDDGPEVHAITTREALEPDLLPSSSSPSDPSPSTSSTTDL